MKAVGKTSEKAALLFPGVIVNEWTPPIEDSDEEASYINYVSSVGSGQFKVKLSEPILLP